MKFAVFHLTSVRSVAALERLTSKRMLVVPPVPSSTETLFGIDTVGSGALSLSKMPTPPCFFVAFSDPLSVEVRLTKKPSAPSGTVSPTTGTEIVFVISPGWKTTFPEVAV